MLGAQLLERWHLTVVGILTLHLTAATSNGQTSHVGPFLLQEHQLVFGGGETAFPLHAWLHTLGREGLNVKGVSPGSFIGTDLLLLQDWLSVHVQLEVWCIEGLPYL